MISRIEFLISRNRISDIKNSHSWYHVFEFLISSIHFLISRIRILDIRNSISWYQKFDFLISRIHFLISRNVTWFISSTKSLQESIWISSTNELKSCAELKFIVDFQRKINAEIHSDFELKTCARLYCDSISNSKLVHDNTVIRFRTQNLCTIMYSTQSHSAPGYAHSNYLRHVLTELCCKQPAYCTYI